MSATNVRIVEVQPDTPLFEQVISLSNANSKYVAHLPIEAIAKEAGKRH